MRKVTSLSTYLRLAKQDIDECLRRVLDDQTMMAGKQSEAYGQLWATISDVIGRGGKRLRPTLALLAYEGFGGQDRAAFMPVAASQELFHAFILMHDDIIDRDLKRWGGLNVAGVYFERLSSSLSFREAMHFAEGNALLAGDVCLNASQQLVLQSSFEPQLLIRASQLLQQTLFEMVGGELEDVTLSLGNEAVPERQLQAMYAHKTAAYTFRLPLQIGALLAGAEAAALRRVARCATDLGIAFQLQDDLLGIFGDEAITGKSTLSDLREGKCTVLMSYALQQSTSAQQEILRACLGNPDVTHDDLFRVKEILIRSGARGNTETLIQNYSKRALKRLAKLGLNPDISYLLTELVAGSTIRTK